MTFSRAKPLGYTDDVDVLPAAEINIIDVNQSRAVDGNAGGPYTPSTRIDLGGSGLRLTGAIRLEYVSRSIQRSQSMVGILGVEFVYDISTLTIVQNLTTGGFIIPLATLPHGGILQTVTLRADGGSGHADDPITGITPYRLFVQRVDNDGSPSALGDTLDDVSSRAAYEAPHDLTVGSIAHTIDLDASQYRILLAGESGADFQAGGRFTSLFVTCDVTEQSEY